MKTYTHFDGESGAEIVRMTLAQAEQCSHSGPCDSDVAENLDRVTWLADDDTLRKSLKGYGAWDDLAEADTDTLRRRALWLGAGDISENPDAYAD